MSRYTLDEGIVLKATDFGEIDRLVTFFTRRRGKFQALAKGARKVGNRFGAALDFFSLSEFLFYTARGMPLVVQGKIQRSFRGLVRTPLRWMAGEYLLHLVDRLFPFEKQEERVLEEILFLWEAFLRSEESIGPLLVRFRLDVAGALGVFPELRKCIHCHRELHNVPSFFSVALGGVVCDACSGRTRELFPLSPEELGFLQSLVDVPLGRVVQLRVHREIFRSLDALLSQYLSYQGESRVPSFTSFAGRELSW
ncbi:MAG: DNA repair protein RecO [Candidatus Caldatribacterium sp.]|nr:DNA repair protein RecO [Candidatus Caldatribacterium sp.]